MEPAGWLAALEASAFAAWMRGAGSAYAVANLVHLLGLTLLLGSMLMLDLRLLGLGRRLPLPEVSRLLTPFAGVGLALQAGSGFALFAADAVPLSGNGAFRIKLAAIALALANAVLFRIRWSDSLVSWDVSPPLAGRIQAALSLALWLSVAAAGRLIAYT
ncbi:hypothetical protein M2650_06045 [Luteimonas sp. SX5]|uniref:DUF6644 domain-containing protein n=1 Tax=Luteimonas galliterrae TaxID=2940486 RepID=A0ABT0MH41_9GAMM|nr:DUF6644 family protein [Luteimonas galliterrae]MCL1634192.1 hypothetical protein [Luteimonas galliterrae]